MNHSNHKHLIYYLLCLLAIIAGITFDQWAASFGYITEQLKMVAPDESIITTTNITHPFSAKILQALSIFCYTLSISIFISVFIIKRLERQQDIEKKEEFDKIQKAINVNVFDTLFKSLIPDEIYAVIKSEVISAKVVRRNANWLYDFSVLDVEKGDLKLIQTVKYEVHNVTREPVEDAISASFDDENIQTGLKRAVCMYNSKEIVSYDRSNNSKNESCTIYSDDSSKVIINKSGTLTKVSINVNIEPGMKVDVTLVFESIYHNNYVNDGFFTKYPLINATLTATYPHDYAFDIFPALSAKLVCTLKDDGRRIYEAKGGILPHQGFVYNLRKPYNNTN